MAEDTGNRYKQFFEDADTDKDGNLTLEELTAALRSRGYKESDLKIKAMFDSVDDSGDRLISLDEYLKAMGELPDNDHKAASIRRVFRQFDKDGNGEIDRSELEAAFKIKGCLKDVEPKTAT
jgi:Ca2+-binding EF-hand superfamily protein